MFRVFLAMGIAVGWAGGCSAAESTATSPVKMLADALLREDAKAIEDAVEIGLKKLGDQAGVPEVPDEYDPVPSSARALSKAEAQRGFAPNLDRLKKLAHWRVGLDPTKMTEPLRGAASVISGCVAVAKAKLEAGEECLELAKRMADFLMWAQEQAGAGCFPFPAARGTSDDRAMAVAKRFLDQAEKTGRLDQVVRNGWAFEDNQDGGLQFDNGECGVAMFELYELTKDERYLNSAKRSADWAANRPLVTNWNYNSFSVLLLAKAYSVTNEARYLDAAVKKAILGVIPGQLRDGPRAGRWMDPHNARPAYHYLMLASLAELSSVLPAERPEYAPISAALKRGLTSRNKEMIERGVMTKDKAVEALILVERHFGRDEDLMTTTHSKAALDRLCRYCSEQARRGKLPLSPRGWGWMLAFLSSNNSSNNN